MKNEYDDLFDLSPSKTPIPAKAMPPPEMAEALPAAATDSHDDDFNLAPSGSQPDEKKPALSEKGIAGLLGAGVAGAFGAKSATSGNSALSRLSERLYGAPAGSLAAAEGLVNPVSQDAVAQRIAAMYAPPVAPAAMMEVPALPETIVVDPNAPTTPGGRWHSKTGYGKGEGTVREVVDRRNLAMPTGKIAKRYVGRLQAAADISAANDARVQDVADMAEAQEKVKAETQARINAAQASNTAEANRVATDTENRKTLQEKMANNIRGAGGLSGILQNAARTALNLGSGAFGGIQAYGGLSDMQQRGATPGNIAQTIEGAGGLYAARNPARGLPVAGVAGMYQAGNSMRDNGLTAENAAKMASGAGLVAMPRNPLVGGALQVPALGMAAADYWRSNPSWLPDWLRPTTSP